MSKSKAETSKNEGFLKISRVFYFTLDSNPIELHKFSHFSAAAPGFSLTAVSTCLASLFLWQYLLLFIYKQAVSKPLGFFHLPDHAVI